MSQKVLLNAKEVNIILHRLACQLIENHNDFTNTVLIGIQPRGKFLANRIAQMLRQIIKLKTYNLVISILHSFEMILEEATNL